jgi:hypothetical protein
LTPESVSEPWLLYEAGVISKMLDRKTRVWTYLLGGLKKEDVPQPLGLFQATLADEGDTFKLLVSVNEALGEHGIPREAVKRQFEKWWPELKEKLSKLPTPKVAVIPKRRPEEMFAELLEFSREGANVRAEIAALASEMNLVGSAVEEIADRLGLLLPTTQTQTNISEFVNPRRFFRRIGDDQAFWTRLYRAAYRSPLWRQIRSWLLAVQIPCREPWGRCRRSPMPTVNSCFKGCLPDGIGSRRRRPASRR